MWGTNRAIMKKEYNLKRQLKLNNFEIQQFNIFVFNVRVNDQVNFPFTASYTADQIIANLKTNVIMSEEQEQQIRKELENYV